MNQKPKSLKLGAAILLISLVLGIPTARLLFFAVLPLEPGSSSSSIIEIHKGQNPNEVTRLLVSQHIIADAKNFIWLGRLGRQWKKLKVGEYRLSASMSPVEVFAILASGVSIIHPITIREGENIYEIAEDLAAKGLSTKSQFLSLAQDPKFISSLGIFKDKLPPSLEGYCFPDTYFFNRALTDTDMARQMVKHFFDFWGKSQETQSLALKRSRHEIITLASMIEKETGAPEERPLISSVFHNRLKQGMKLQSDPTTIYGMWNDFHGKIHKSDLFKKNKYNTYIIPALPIGPIGNPGKDAIQAALYPADSSFLYFVSHNNGTHQFSKNLSEHNRAVQMFQLNPKARQGKSWRDRLKSP